MQTYTVNLVVESNGREESITSTGLTLKQINEWKAIVRKAAPAGSTHTWTIEKEQDN